MDIARAFTYAFDDEEWSNKLPITLILGFIPIVNFAALGWGLDLIRNMLAGNPRPMPAWDGETLGDRFVSGLMLAIGILIYNIILVVILCALGAVGGMLGAGRGGVVGFGFDLCLRLITWLYMAAAAMPLSVAIIRYARTRDFSAFLDIARNINIVTENMPIFIILAVYMFVASLIISVVGLIPCVGWLLSLFSFGVNIVIFSHLIGQAGVEVMRKSQGGA